MWDLVILFVYANIIATNLNPTIPVGKSGFGRMKRLPFLSLIREF